MKLLPSLPCTLYASRVSGCCRDIQLTSTTICRSSFILPPLSSPRSSRRQVSSSPFGKGSIQRQRRWLPVPSGSRNLYTNAAVDVKDTPESRNRKKEQEPSNTTNNRDQQDEDASSLSHKVRLLMRRVPHPVAIITASDRRALPPDSNKKPIFRGMTVSSFNTVTLSPEPVVSFNVRRPSETLNALQSSGRFLVHLLAPSAATAKLARDFSRGNENLQLYQKGGMGEFEFGGVNYGDDNEEEPLPILRRNNKKTKNNENSKGTLLAQESESESESVIDFPFIFECKYLPQQAIQVYDHTIVLGSVVRVIEQQHQHQHQQPQPQPQPQSTTGIQQQNKIKEKEEGNEFFCLTYADTRFWKMGDQI